jgi:hypothetical protein
MTLSGFTFVRNANKYHYPAVESITSALSICDEFIVNVGDSDDGTLDSIRAIESPKLKIVTSIWDPALRTSGEILARQTDIALSHCSGDWALYLQADEVLHEADLPVIREAIKRHQNNRRVEGFLFNYAHFYGSYEMIACGRRWYRHEVRLLKPDGVSSFRDAQGFRKWGRKPRVVALPVTVFHYGWVRPPRIMGRKKADFDRLWHDDKTVERMNPAPDSFTYDRNMFLQKFSGTHPSVMRKRVQEAAWVFDPPAESFTMRGPIHERLFWEFEKLTGFRIGEYRNYRIVGRWEKDA